MAVRMALLWIEITITLMACAATATPPRQVFAHYMVCCTLDRSDATVEQLADEISLARSYGIDGFALNIGAWTREPLYRTVADRMFEAARGYPGFKLFLSADHVSPEEAADMLARYAADPAYLRINGRPMLSTFGSDPGWDAALRRVVTARRLTITFVPHEYPSGRGGNAELPDAATFAQQYAMSPRPDGYFYFGAAGTCDRIAASSRAAAAAAKAAGIYYMAPVTPYYQGRGGNNRVFDNCGFGSMAAEWRAAIDGGATWVEIVTWNDYQEGSYVRPFGDPALRPPGRWAALLPHDGFLAASQPYIHWFKTGTPPRVTKDQVTLFYRPQPAADCGGANGEPTPCLTNHETLADRIYFAVEARAETRLTVRSGAGTTVLRFAAGRSLGDAPLAPGALSIESASGGEVRRWSAPLGFGVANRGLNEAMLGWSF